MLRSSWAFNVPQPHSRPSPTLSLLEGLGYRRCAESFVILPVWPPFVFSRSLFSFFYHSSSLPLLQPSTVWVLWEEGKRGENKAMIVYFFLMFWRIPHWKRNIQDDHHLWSLLSFILVMSHCFITGCPDRRCRFIVHCVKGFHIKMQFEGGNRTRYTT